MPLSKEADRLRKQRQRAADKDHLARWAKYPHKCPKCGRVMSYQKQDCAGGVTKYCWNNKCLNRLDYIPRKANTTVGGIKAYR